MTKEEKIEILEGAKAAFFEAMLDGYAGGENRRSVKTRDNDGYTTITYKTEDGKYKVVDRYCTTPLSDKSSGTTTIFCGIQLIVVPVWSPIWWMSYGGRYPKNAIPFLKFALEQTYASGVFCWGRGINCFDVNLNLEYQNIGAGDFERFQGGEGIIDLSTNKTIGFHKYFGMSLL